MASIRSLFLASLLAYRVVAGDDEWQSPVYKDFYKFPLPIPIDKTPKTYVMPRICAMPKLTYTLRSYTNATTKATIDYYEVEVKSFEQEVYPGLKKAKLVGYDGMSPGPTFRMTKGREAVVRFVNKEDMAISIHLHGSYSMSQPSYTLHIATNMSQAVHHLMAGRRIR